MVREIDKPKAEVKQLKDKTHMDIGEWLTNIDEPKAEVKQVKNTTQRDIDGSVTNMDEPKVEVEHLTFKDGSDKTYDAENDLSIIKSTVYISGTKIDRASDWYDDILEVPSLWNAAPVVNQWKHFVWNKSPTICRGFRKAGR